MQQILSIDLTCEPARGLLVAMTAEGPQVRETVEESVRPESLNPESPETRDAIVTSFTGSPTFELPFDSARLRALLGKVQGSFSELVLVAPVSDYLSLNLELPFRDPKSLSRVLDGEVQDLVPFPTDDFLLTHQTVGSLNGHGAHDIHVGIVPKGLVKLLIEACAPTGHEPAVVSTPTSAIASLAIATNQTAQGAQCIVLVRDTFWGIVTLLEGTPRSDRIIMRSRHRPGDTPGDAFLPLDELRATIKQFELRYHQPVTTILVDGPATVGQAISHGVGLPTQLLADSSTHLRARPQDTLALGAAFFVKEDKPTIPLSNLRAREFGYNPALKHLLAATKPLMPYVLAFLVALILVPVAIYSVRAMRLSSMESRLYTAVAKTFPDLTVPAGNEAVFVAGQSQKMRQLVDDVGSPTQVSALEALLALSNDIPADSPVQVRKVSIRGTRVSVQVISPNSNYAALDKLERALERRKDLYHRVTKKVSDGGFGEAGTVNATFDLILKE